MATKLDSLVGQKVLVSFKGLQLIGTLESISDHYGGRAMVKIPPEKKARCFWLSKVSPLPVKNSKKT